MGARNNVIFVFMLCAILSTIESRPSKTPSSSAARQGQLEDIDGQVNHIPENNGKSHAGRPYGNDIMMKGQPKTKDMDKAIKYMYKYGYMPVPKNPGSEMPEMTPENVKENIKKMQMMMGLPMTGQLDPGTMGMIDRPRCGVHDPVDVMVVPLADDIPSDILSPQKFVHYGQRWPTNTITYRILNYPYMLDPDDAYKSIQQAFDVWSNVTSLTFIERVAGYADIYLKFGRYEHGDLYPFDGRGGVLAHAFLPQSGQGDLEGDVHFDDDEYFTYQSYQGNNLFYVAAHEIGHALGLHHSLNYDALMAPFINPYDPEFTLHPDDIAGIQDLYGAPSATTDIPDAESTVTQSTTGNSIDRFTTQPPRHTTASPTEDELTTPTPSDPYDSDYFLGSEDTNYQSSSFPFHSSFSSLYSADDTSSDFNERCPPYHTFFSDNDGEADTFDGKNVSNCAFAFDAVTSYRGEIFAFKGDRYWRATRDSGLISPPNGDEVKYFFESFPNDIDAAYEQYLSSKLFVFKGSNYYVYNGISLESGPLPISYLDPSLPDDVDAVLTWGEWHKTYFFKDDLVWRFDERYQTVDHGWPWLIKEIWTGVPHYLTSAFRWGDYTNFLRGDQLYAYDDYCYYVNPLDNPKSFSVEFTDGCPK